MQSLIIVHSYHHRNTEQVATAMAEVLDAQVVTPQEVHTEDLDKFDLIGFGSGIYGAQHHESVLSLADTLPHVSRKNAFIFSTSAILGAKKVAQDHEALRSKLQSRGYKIVDEFSCKGFNTNSFLKYFGGMNKGRPNSDDLDQAREFVRNLKDLIDV